MHHNVPRLFNLRVLLSKSPSQSVPVTQWSLHPLWNAFFSCLPGYHTHLFAFYLTSHITIYFVFSFISPISYSLPTTLLCHFFFMNSLDFYWTYLLPVQNLKFTSPVKMIFLNSGFIDPTTYLTSPLDFLNLPSQTRFNLTLFPPPPTCSSHNSSTFRKWKALPIYSNQRRKKQKRKPVESSWTPLFHSDPSQ